MAEAQFLDSLQDLTGKVAIVTGGAAGIGLETTIYLASKGATVYVASRNPEKSEAGIAEARQHVGAHGGKILFHQLDLASIRTASESADAFKQRESRLDIMVCNAGIGMCALNVLSPDGYERAFATNHLGHFQFVMRLVDLIESTAQVHGDARIVMVSSMAYGMAERIDYDALTHTVADDGTKLRDLKGAMTRYGNSKLANIYFALELDRRLRERSINNVYCNSCHPGSVPNSGLGANEQTPLPPGVQKIIRNMFSVASNTVQDAAKTQVYLAASGFVKEHDVHGEYWQPWWSVPMRRYKGCRKVELSDLARDQLEWYRLWMFSEEAVGKSLGRS